MNCPYYLYASLKKGIVCIYLCMYIIAYIASRLVVYLLTEWIGIPRLDISDNITAFVAFSFISTRYYRPNAALSSHILMQFMVQFQVKCKPRYNFEYVYSTLQKEILCKCNIPHNHEIFFRSLTFIPASKILCKYLYE